jgi:hypothetical protein
VQSDPSPQDSFHVGTNIDVVRQNLRNAIGVYDALSETAKTSAYRKSRFTTAQTIVQTNRRIRNLLRGFSGPGRLPVVYASHTWRLSTMSIESKRKRNMMRVAVLRDPKLWMHKGGRLRDRPSRLSSCVDKAGSDDEARGIHAALIAAHL